MIKKYLECGKIVSTHGVRGEMKVQPWCDSPDFLCGFSQFYTRQGKLLLDVEEARVNKNMVLLKARGVDSVEKAVTMRGQILYIDREEAPANEDGEYYIQDLLGLEVRDADTGKIWGELKDVLRTGANDVYAIAAPDGRQLLAPAIPDVVLETNLEDGYMVIRPLEGLFDAN